MTDPARRKAYRRSAPARRLASWFGGHATAAAIAALLMLAVLFLAFPLLWPGWLALGLFFSLLPLGLAIHWTLDRRSGAARRLFGPLALFTVAFVAVLGVRALDLLAGGDGRYYAVTPDGTSERLTIAPLRQDSPEVDLGSTTVESSDTPLQASLSSRDPWVGSVSLSVRLLPRSEGYRTLLVGTPAGREVAVAPGKTVAASLAVRVPSTLPPRAELQLYSRFRSATGEFISDEPVADPVTAESVGDGWRQLHGAVRAPDDAASASALLLVRSLRSGQRYVVDLDAPLLLLGNDEQVTGFAAGGVESQPVRDSYRRALAIAIATMLAVFAGYLAGIGGRLGSRLPGLGFADLAKPSVRRLIGGITIIGVAAYVVEMSTYGGYPEYLRSLDTVWQAAEGKWYLRAIATAPMGMAVALGVRRLFVARGEPWRLVEIATLVIGPSIAASYWVKTTIVLPLVAFLVCCYFIRRRAAIWLWVTAGAVALLTPFVYIVRGAGAIDLGSFFSGAYWNEFIDNLTSRFFQFESLMLASGQALSEAPWRPLTDLVSSAVPRVLWDDKPLSASAEFTDKYLLPGLHTPTDIGVSSLPGEFWIHGGALGVLTLGFALGVFIRVLHAGVVAQRAIGTLLLCAGGLTAALQLNDGEGIASVIVLNLIAAFGWLVLLRPLRRPETGASQLESQPADATDTPVPALRGP